MPGIAEIIQETNQKSRVNSREKTRRTLIFFLEIVKQKLNKGESVNFKGYFTLKRSAVIPKGDKRCAKHEKSVNDYKKINKNKGIAAFAKSEKFRDLVQEIRNCKDCQKRKAELLKSAKLNKRVVFKPGKFFWITKSGKRGRR